MYMNFVVLALCVCVWAKWFLIIALFPSQVARVTCYKKHSTFAYIFSIPIRLVEKILRGGVCKVCNISNIYTSFAAFKKVVLYGIGGKYRPPCRVSFQNRNTISA